jgi:hypothetical protein
MHIAWLIFSAICYLMGGFITEVSSNRGVVSPDRQAMGIAAGVGGLGIFLADQH